MNLEFKILAAFVKEQGQPLHFKYFGASYVTVSRSVKKMEMTQM